MDLVLVGAGPVGIAAARAALDDGVARRMVAVVDRDQGAAGEGARILGGRPLDSVEGLPAGDARSAAILAFSSRGEQTVPVARALVDNGFHVVTTCEQLADPTSQITESLDRLARSAERSIVVTGANPGFAMDRLPVLLASACRNVTSVEVRRVVDTATRRGPLLSKTGRGLTTDDFDRRVAEGAVGHVGLVASARLVAAGLGWDPSGEAEEQIDPVLDGAFVSGIHQTVRVSSTEGTVNLELTMAWHTPDASDTVIIEGEPPLRVVIPGGYHGDLGTSAQVVAGMRACLAMAPGIHLPIDLPVSPHR
jgi:4-hydroxy-tetrahydrodipicolinate reductase